jgi:spore coat polysaccharide biosynthesis protein SpsF
VTAAILQARMTSTRLPGKVLMDIAGAPMLAHVLRRLLGASLVDEVVVATTTNSTDDPVVAEAQRAGVRWFRGDEHDVLSRYAGAAEESGADRILRVTADCPLLDPGVVDRVIAALEPGVDYASNVIDRTFPAGLDSEAFPSEILARVDRDATSPEARQHVTWFLYSERPDLFALRSVVDDEDNSDLRWTVDFEDDLALVRRLYDELGLAHDVRPYRDVVAFVRAHPELAPAVG